MPWSLCSKEDIAAMHPIVISELSDAWSDMVEGLIRSYMGQPYLGTLQAITDEYHNGDGTPILFVNKSPINSVTSLRVSGFAWPTNPDGVTLSSDDYVVFDTYLQLKYMVFPRSSMNVVISYVSGTTVVDETVRLAAVAMIVAIINYRRRFGADSSLKWGADRSGDKKDRQVGQDSPNLNVGLTSHMQAIMKRVLRRPVVRVR